MADAWETLINNSTLGAGHDAWEHLNAQEGGGGGETIYYGVSTLKVNQSKVSINLTNKTTINILQQQMLTNVKTKINLLIKSNNIQLRICE